MASTLKELIDIVSESVHTESHMGEELSYKDNRISFDSGRTEYDMSPVAFKALAKILGIPAAYLNKIPEDLRDVNIEFLAKQKQDPIIFVFADNFVSEIHDSNEDRTASQVLDEIATVSGEEYKVIQADIDANHLFFYAFDEDDQIDTPYGKLAKGFAIYVELTGKRKVYPNPVLVNTIEETVIEGHYTAPEDMDETSISETLGYVLDLKDPFGTIINSASDKKQNVEVMANKLASNVGLKGKARGYLLDELLMSPSNTTKDLINSAMNCQMRVKSIGDVMKLGNITGAIAYYHDPIFCSKCHHELDD
jgi:hypothetical protein